MSSQKKLYFTAGPAKLPTEVMEQMQREFLNYNDLDISVAELSHRSKEFDAIITEAEANLRKLMDVPDNYAILFMHGGAKTQFDSIPMNLCPELDNSHLDYIVDGSWSKMAAKEAEKYAKVSVQTFKTVPSKYQLVAEDKFVYRYYCDNETIQGLEFNYVPECGSECFLVCDMTSNFLTRPVDVNKFGVIFASSQKNSGISGLAIVIIRQDLIGRHMKITPTIQNYKITHDNRSLYNTPPTFAIYSANLCYKWCLERGGLKAMDEFCKKKSGLLYNTIESSNGFYTCPVEKNCRSRTNVVFLLGNSSLESKFLEEAKSCGLNELKGHRSVGGFRASLYHGISFEDVQRLVKFMNEFKLKYS